MKVKCINNKDCPHLTVDKIYDVILVWEDRFFIEDDNGQNPGVKKYMFVEVTDTD